MVVSSDILSGATTAQEDDEEEDTGESDKEETTTAPQPPVPAEPRNVDMNLGMADVTEESAMVRWRPFSPEERALVDGVQVRHRMLIWVIK